MIDLLQSISSEPSAHSKFPLQYTAHIVWSSLQGLVSSGHAMPNEAGESKIG